jgi:hypothetical protein
MQVDDIKQKDLTQSTGAVLCGRINTAPGHAFPFKPRSRLMLSALGHVGGLITKSYKSEFASDRENNRQK